MTADWPRLEVRSAGAADSTSTARLLRGAIDKALADGAPGALIKRIFLNCLADMGMTWLEPGLFAVEGVQSAQLGSAVRRACDRAGPGAWDSYARYDGKLRSVLRELGALVDQREVAKGNLVALLRADALLGQQGAGEEGEEQAEGQGEAEAGTQRLPAEGKAAEDGAAGYDAEGEGDWVPEEEMGAAHDKHLGPLLFSVSPTALPFRIVRLSPGAVHFALNRALNVRLTGLAHAAVVAVLKASPLRRCPRPVGSSAPAPFSLGSCAVAGAQRGLLAWLKRRPGGQLLREFEGRFSADLGQLLASEPACAALVRLSPGGGRALLLADVVLGKACLVMGGSQGEEPLAVGSHGHPDTPPASEPGGAAQLGWSSEQEGEAGEPKEVEEPEGLALGIRAIRVAPPPPPPPLPPPMGPRPRRQLERGGAAAAPAALLRRLQAALGERAAQEAGLEGGLVGSFLAVHCSRTAAERRTQAAVLAALLRGPTPSWKEACAFMDTTVRMSAH